jgi:HEPN domain-containing protein
MVTADCLEWLKFARGDITVAQDLFEKQTNPRHRQYDAILYHCQQGAEKALKAYVIQNGVLTAKLKTHDMHMLRQECVKWSKRFDMIRMKHYCSYLEPFSVKIRYPGHGIPLDSDIAFRGLNFAKRIYDMTCEELGLKKIYF